MTVWRRLILVCFFLSGVSSLIYEVVWMRRLELVFGSTTVAISTIQAAFMGGLALGSWLIGRWSDRLQGACPASWLLIVYALLEWGIGLYALLLPSLFDRLPSLYRWFFGFFHLEVSALDPVQFILASLLLVISTMLMGGTFPLLACWTIQRTEGIGLTTGTLYAVNTGGAVAGAALAGFLLLPLLGLSRATVIAVGLNLGIGLVALLVARAQASGRKACAASRPARGDSSPGRKTFLPLLAALMTAGTSGFVAMGYEVAWTRVLALVLGSSTYAFTIMLATFLTGLAAGSHVASRFVDRLRRPLLVLAAVQAATGVAVFVSQYAFSSLPTLFLQIFSWVGHLWWLFLACQFGLAFLVMLGPTLALGGVFPLVVRLTGTSLNEIGESVGRVYAVNTVGAVLGAVAAAMWLIPRLGINSTVLLLLLANLGAGVLVLLVAECGITFKLAGACLLSVGMVATVAWAPAWKPLVMASGVYREAPALLKLYGSPHEALRMLKGTEILYYKDGLTATVSVVEKPLLGETRHLALAINGKVDASTSADMATQILSGHLPLLLKPSAESVLVIGYASGMTVGSVLRHPVKEVTAVEIEPAVLEASHHFDEFNHQPLADPRVNLIVADARAYLGLTLDRFDVVISEPSNPWMSGPAKLFTEEFFRLGRDHLTPQGLFAQWLPLYGLTPEHVQALVRTFHAVFPSVLVFQTAPGDLLLLGAVKPLRLDYQAAATRLAEPAVAADLQRTRTGDMSALLATFLLGDREVDRYVGAGVRNTDDNGLIEFAAPRSLYLDTIPENRRALKRARGWVWNYLTNVGDTDKNWAAVLVGVARRALEYKDWDQAEAQAARALQLSPSPVAAWILGESYAQRESLVSAANAWRHALELDPAFGPARVSLARLAVNQGRYGETQQLVAALSATQQQEAEGAFLRGLVLYRQGRVRDAVEAFRFAESGRRDGELPFLHYYLEQVYGKLGLANVAHQHREAFLADLDKVRLALERKVTAEGLTSPEPLVTDYIGMRFDEEATRLFEQRVLAPLAHYSQGLTFVLLGYEEKAEEQFLEVLRLIGPRGTSPLTHYYLALTYQRMDKPDLATVHLRKVVDSPDSAEGLAAVRTDARRRLARLSTTARKSALCADSCLASTANQRGWL
ncbi:fused MFS/spermidine synthase [Nitrospira sp. Kam-Ns4a]